MAENYDCLKSIENNHLDGTSCSLNMTSSPGGDVPDAVIEERKETDSRSVYVGNVDYGAAVEELKRHFDGCGSINRATILSNKSDGSPKGYAFIEFGDKDNVQTAMAMDGSLFRGRKIQVLPKRTNKPGISSTDRPPGSCGRDCPFRDGASPRRGSEAKRSIPDSILGAQPPRRTSKSYLDTVHAKKEIYRAPNVNPKPTETVTSARCKPNLNIVHAMKEICRALKINPNALHRESATSARFKPNLDIVQAMKEIFRALDVNPNELPRETVTTARLKPNLDIVHAKKEIYRALNINLNAPSRETVKCAQFERRTSKRTLDIVHAKKEIYRALNINTNALHRETVKSGPKNMQPHGAQPPGPPLASENKENSNQLDGNCSRSQNRNRTAMHLDSESCKDGCFGKHTSDSGRQTSSSSSSWKRLQLEQMKEEVKQLVLDRPDGVWCMELMELYREQYDRELNYLCFGYKSIVSFACSLEPRVLVSDPTESGDCLLHDARRVPGPSARAQVRRLTASRLRPAGAPVDPDDALPGIDFTGATLNSAKIHAFLRDGIALDYVDDYRQHVPVEAYRPPPTPASDPSPSPSPTPSPTPPLKPRLELVSRVPLFSSQLVSSQDSGSESDSYDIVTEEPCSSSNFMAQPYPSMQLLFYPMYPPHGTLAPQFYQMSPAPPGQHHPTPVPPLRRPYLSSTKPVESPVSEKKTLPRPRSPPPLDNLDPPPQFDQMPPAPPGQHHPTPVPALRRPYLNPAKPAEFLASETKTPPRPRSPRSLDKLDPPPQFDQMPPAPPSQHHPTPMQALRRPYLSLAKAVESPASETKTPPRPRSPPSLDNLDPPLQFDQMPPAPPSQHHPTPMPALRRPYLSLTKPVESPASEMKTPPRPRSPPPLDNLDPPPQFYQMAPAPLSQYHPLPVTPGQHHPTPVPPLRCPYLSPTKSVEFPACETKTSPRPRSPPPPYNHVSGGGGADAGGRSGGGETRRVNKVHGDVTLTASECKIFSLISGVDPKVAHWYMVDAIGRRMTTSNTTVTSAVVSTLNTHAAELQQVTATQTEACAGSDSLQPAVSLFMESLQSTPRPPPGFE